MILLTIAAACETVGADRADEPGVPHDPAGGGPIAAVDDPFPKLWGAENESGSHDPTRAEAIADARALDSISALRITYPRHLKGMRRANPAGEVLAYVMGVFAWRQQSPGVFPETWYLKDEDGSFVRSTGEWGDHFLMDPSEPGWVADRVSMCLRFLKESGYDGCMVDVLGLAPLSSSFVTGIPIDDRTGRPWTPSDWLRATSRLARSVKRAVHPAVVIGNGLGSGPAYFSPKAPTSQLLRGLDGAIAEAWLRPAKGDPDHRPTVRAWRQNVDMLVRAGDRGKRVMTLTKLWVSTDLATRDAWYRFALASFLLGTDGRSYFAFSPARDYDPTEPFGAAIEMGSPLGRYRPVGAAFARRFQRGTVFVNPTGDSIEVELAASGTTMEGVAVSGRLVLPPGTGEIVFRGP